MAESKMPAMIWATCNGMSTRLPDGHRQFVGGWSEDKDRPRAEQFIRADLVEPLVEALRASQAALTVMTAPKSIMATSTAQAYAHAYAAECKARSTSQNKGV